MVELAVRTGPGQAQHRPRIIQVVEQVEDQLLALAAADEIHLRALTLDLERVEGYEHAAECDPDLGVGSTDLPHQDLGVRVAGRRQEAQPDQIGLPARDLVENDLIGRLWVRLVEHQALVAGPLEDRRQRHDADRRKADDLRHPPLRTPRRRVGKELRVAYVNQQDSHRDHWVEPPPPGQCSPPLVLRGGRPNARTVGAMQW